MVSSIPTNLACDGARQILDAALEVFAAHGYEGASIHAIAQRAGVSKANVFHHFASKEQLYLAVLRNASRSWGEDLAHVPAIPGGFPAQLQAMIHRTLQHLMRENAQSRVVLREMLENGALRGRQLSEEVFADNFEIETEIFRRAQADGNLRSGVDPVLAWMMTMAVCAFFFQTRDVMRFNPAYPYAESPDRYARDVCDALLHGIAAPRKALQ
jgi:TetR/AcrR family transcriptional regulator